MLSVEESGELPSLAMSRKRRVSFNESLNSIAITEEDMDPSELWYTPEEMQSFKKENKRQARDIVHGRKEYSEYSYFWRQALERCYQAVCDETLESFEDEEVDFEQSVLNEAEQQNLKLVYSEGAVPLGLEHMVSDMIKCGRTNRRNEQVDRVYQIEDSVEEFPDEELQEQFMRFTCEALSLAARLFSREVARALEADVKEVPDLQRLDDDSISTSSSSSFEHSSYLSSFR